MTPPRRRISSSNYCSVALLLLLSAINPSQARSIRSTFAFGKETSIWGRYRNIGRGGSLSEVQPDHQSTASATASASASIDTLLTPTNTSANITSNQTIPDWKRQLPAPLCYKQSRTFQRICVPYQNRRADIYLLGTAHVSNDSSRDVQLLLESLKPDAIFVELCEQRTSMLEDPPVEACRNTSAKFWEKVANVQLQNNHSRLQSMATVLLTQTQEEYAETLGVELGGEFRRAYQYWNSFVPTTTTTTEVPDRNQRQGGRPHLILGDRPLAITLARAWESLSWFGKLKVLFGLVISTFQKPKPEELRKWIQSILEDDTDLLSSSLEDLRKHFPTLERVIIRERDAYMACKLYQVCRGMLVSAARNDILRQQSLADSTSTLSSSRQQQSQEDGQDEDLNPIVIVALVGAGHVPGICEWLTTKTHPQGPEDLLATLIATKKFAHEDLSPLVYDVTELQPRLDRLVY